MEWYGMERNGMEWNGMVWNTIQYNLQYKYNLQYNNAVEALLDMSHHVDHVCAASRDNTGAAVGLSS